MGVYAELRGFVVSHRDCGVLRGRGEAEPSGEGYRLLVVCPCGARFDRWLSVDDPDTERLRATLAAFEG